VATAAVYDIATNAWASIASMPLGVNHAAATTDGSKFYVIGGRGGANVVSNGVDAVQIYDPATDSWQSSTTPGSTLAPLPQARGGTGKAVYYNGEVYVIGGETATGAGATANNVYNRVDVYNPLTNTWRLAPAMPTARHGIHPVLFAGRIYVAGGGVTAANSQSIVVEVFNP
jgi:N-acetylneuraminic acid mutarotase